MLLCCDIVSCFCFFSSRRRHTRCALVTGVQTCALPIYPYLPRVEGVVTNVRAHKAEPTWVQIDVEVEGAETQTFALIPMPWHTGNQLLRYAQYNEGRLSSVIYQDRSEEHTSELQSLMRISYAVFCLKKKKNHTKQPQQ